MLLRQCSLLVQNNAILRSQIVFYGSADMTLQNEISDHKQQFTSPNDNFEYSYFLSIIVNCKL